MCMAGGCIAVLAGAGAAGLQMASPASEAGAGAKTADTEMKGVAQEA